MDTLNHFLTWISGHAQIEMALLSVGVVITFLTRHTQRIPPFHPILTPRTETPPPPVPGTPAAELAALGFTPVAKYDASMNPSVTMVIDVLLSADLRCLAAVVMVRTASREFSFVEFDSDLAPHGNLTTNNNNEPIIFYRPPDKMIAKAPWKKDLAGVFNLHQALCETASGCGFTPVLIKPESVREHLINGVRDSMDDQVKCGRMVKVSEGVYRASFKGALIFFPLVAHKTIFSLIRNLRRPSDQAICARLEKRLQRAHLMREPYSASLRWTPAK